MSLSNEQMRALASLTRAAQSEGLSDRSLAAFLATAWQESSWRPRAVGDNGTSFGLFQHHVGGAGGSTLQSARRFLNPAASASERARQFARLNIRGGSGAAALQRPANSEEYARSVDALTAQLLNGTHPSGVTVAGGGVAARGGRAKWSPLRDAVRRKASQLGLRHTSGDRDPARNEAAGGATNSHHLSTNTGSWADDYVGAVDKMNELVRWAEANGAYAESMVHDAGSGLHAHISGAATLAGGSEAVGGTGRGGLQNAVDLTPGLDLPSLDKIGGVVRESVVTFVVLALGIGFAVVLMSAGLLRTFGLEKTAAQGITAGAAPAAAAVKGAAL